MVQAGQVLQEHYRLIRPLAVRSECQTWLADDLRPDGAAVIALQLRALEPGQLEDLQRVEETMQSLQSLASPAIARYYPYFSHRDQGVWLGIVREYVPGVSLQEMVARHQVLTLANLRSLAITLLQGLSQIHSQSPDLLHGNLHPGNLILAGEQATKLVDFAIFPPPSASVFVGQGYAPMEQLMGHAVPASDLYSLGTTLLYGLTGIIPTDWPQHNLRLQIAERLTLPGDYIRWLETLVEPIASKRFATAEAALLALQELEPLGEGTSNPTFSPAEKVFNAVSPQSEQSLSPPASSSPVGDYPILMRRSPHEFLIEIPSPFFKVPSVLDPGQISPFPYASLAEKLLWRERRLQQIFRVNPRMVFLGLLALSIVVFVFLPDLRLVYGTVLLAGVLTLLYLTQSSFIYLNRSRNFFQIYKALFPAYPQRYDQRLSTIEDIYISTPQWVSPENRKMIRATVQAGKQKFLFGEGLNQTECRWLVDEIKQWLQNGESSPGEF